jgi:energy-coupling factor transporter ATP-binding protein EcfA2
MTTAGSPIPPGMLTLTGAQEAALARLGCTVTGQAAAGGTGRGGTVAVLCGPPGVGKTTVLERLAAALPPGSAEIRPVNGWLEATAIPACVLVDDAHATDAVTLAAFVARAQEQRPAASLVLAGEGRLLTLLTRDRRLERAVGLRASLGPCRLADTGRLLAERVADGTAIAETVQEITGGITADIIRLATLATVLAESRPDRRLEPADIEIVHRRLTLAAA